MQHQSADGFLCLCLDHFPKHVKSTSRAGGVALTALCNCCVVWKETTCHGLVFICFPKSGFLCSSPMRGQRVWKAASSPLPSPALTQSLRGTCSSFSVRSAAEHRLLQTLQTVLGIRSAQLLPCSCVLVAEGLREGSNVILLK